VTLATAVAWMARLAGVATVVAALELVWIRHAVSDAGVFRWATLRRDFAGAPAVVRAIADRVFCARGIQIVIAVQLASGLALPWLAHPAPAWLAFATTFAIAIRFRGSYNGGSDSMLLVVLLALALARSAPGGWLAPAALAYAAAQLVLSYFIAGVAKLRDPRWRRGTALPILVQLPHYGVPARAQAILSRPGVARVATAAMLGFECGFPVALLDPTVCLGLLGAGVAFHLGNAVVFGLNRFLWAWLAGYPALVFWVERLR
jgi:hypothetical protein